MHYDVVSNGVLWFLFHDLFDRDPPAALRRALPREAWDAYRAVNDAFAEGDGRRSQGRRRRARERLPALAGQAARPARASPRPAHRALHAHAVLRARRHRACCPTYAAEDLCRALATQSRRLPQRPVGQRVPPVGARRARSARRADRAEAFAASLGIDVAALDAVATSRRPRTRAANALDDAVGDRLVIARSDRIEPSKNIVRGFLAYDRLLEARPGLRGRVVFVAMLYASRETLPEYLAAHQRHRAGRRARQRNRWRDPRLDANPARSERDDFPRSVAAMQRYDVLLVNPIKDGLNLVAKEGPAVNRRDGLLCLSRRGRRLRRAQVPAAIRRAIPTTSKARPGALDRALATPLDERAAQSRRCCVRARGCAHPVRLAERPRRPRDVAIWSNYPT